MQRELAEAKSAVVQAAVEAATSNLIEQIEQQRLAVQELLSARCMHDTLQPRIIRRALIAVIGND